MYNSCKCFEIQEGKICKWRHCCWLFPWWPKWHSRLIHNLAGWFILDLGLFVFQLEKWAGVWGVCRHLERNKPSMGQTFDRKDSRSTGSNSSSHLHEYIVYLMSTVARLLLLLNFYANFLPDEIPFWIFSYLKDYILPRVLEIWTEGRFLWKLTASLFGMF